MSVQCIRRKACTPLTSSLTCVELRLRDGSTQMVSRSGAAYFSFDHHIDRGLNMVVAMEYISQRKWNDFLKRAFPVFSGFCDVISNAVEEAM